MGGWRRFDWSKRSLVVAGVVAVFTALSILFPGNLVASNLSHFRLQYGILAALAGAILLATRYPSTGLVALLLASFHLWAVASYSIPGTRPVATTPSLKVFYANVHISNTETAALRRLVEEEAPDVVALLEVGRHWEEGLEWARERYPWRQEAFRSDCFGVALYSSIPFETAAILATGPVGVPSLRAEFCWESVPVVLYVTHPLPPITLSQFAWLKTHLSQVARWTAADLDSGRPVILVGDLNMTEANPWLGDLLGQGRLRDSRRGHGWQASWPDGYIPLFGIPLDHVLVSDSWQISRRAVGPSIGSDHLPVRAELRLDPS